MATIASLGVGSNLDLDTLLTKIVAAEKEAPQAFITNRQNLATATISAIGTLKSKLTAFQDAQAKLKDATFFAGKTAISSNTDAFTVSAKSTADTGTYDISVLNLAKANKVASGNFVNSSTVVGNGTLTIGVGGTTFNVAVTAGVNDTLAGIRDAINNAPTNAGVKATILTVSNGAGGTANKLVLTANTTGTSSQLSVSVADGDGTNTDNTGLSKLYYLKGDVASQLSEIAPAQDAKITVDGFEATSGTNQFSDVVPGVTITAVKGATDPLDPATAPSGTLSLSNDQASIKAAITTFVTAYNDLTKTINGLATPSTDSTSSSSSGALSGDSSLLAIRSQLKQVLASPVSGAATDLNTLAFVGISTNPDGTLTLDSSKFADAVNTRGDDVKKLFSGTNGVSGKLNSLITNLVGSGGVLQTRTDSLNTQLRHLTDQQSALNARIDSLTQRYRAQFSALDSLVSQLNSTGSFLTTQLDAASKIITRKSQ